MKSLRPVLCRAVLALLCLSTVISCASRDDNTVEYGRKLKHKNDEYFERQEKRKMKLRARQKRVDMWFDSLMN